VKINNELWLVQPFTQQQCLKDWITRFALKSREPAEETTWWTPAWLTFHIYNCKIEKWIKYSSHKSFSLNISHSISNTKIAYAYTPKTVTFNKVWIQFILFRKHLQSTIMHIYKNHHKWNTCKTNSRTLGDWSVVVGPEFHRKTGWTQFIKSTQRASSLAGDELFRPTAREYGCLASSQQVMTEKLSSSY